VNTPAHVERLPAPTFAARTLFRLLSRLALVTGMAPIVAPLIGSQILRRASTVWSGYAVQMRSP